MKNQYFSFVLLETLGKYCTEKVCRYNTNHWHPKMDMIDDPDIAPVKIKLRLQLCEAHVDALDICR